ncbi:FmdB family zinc ribbon protein [Chloroflexota bacterium]
MPIYEYVCTDCKEKFELLRPFSRADEEAECPQCDNTAERVLSTICCITTNENGVTSSIAGNSCSTCGSSSCATCAM